MEEAGHQEEEGEKTSGKSREHSTLRGTQSIRQRLLPAFSFPSESCVVTSCSLGHTLSLAWSHAGRPWPPARSEAMGTSRRLPPVAPAAKSGSSRFVHAHLAALVRSRK